MSRDQADGAAQAIAESMSTELATKSDILDVRSAIVTLEGDMSTEIAAVRTEIAAARTEIAAVRTDIAAAGTSTAKWIIGAVLVNSLTVIGGMIAIWQIGHK